MTDIKQNCKTKTKQNQLEIKTACVNVFFILIWRVIALCKNMQSN